jgi:hypothetical protein
MSSGASGSQPATFTRFVVTCGVIWVACAAVATLVIHFGMDTQDRSISNALEKYGVTVEALVTKTDPGDHNTVYYAFTASDGRPYRSASAAEPPNPDASQLRVGDRIHVVYDRRNPHLSCACNPRENYKGTQWWREAFGAFFVTSIIALALTFMVTRRRSQAA